MRKPTRSIAVAAVAAGTLTATFGAGITGAVAAAATSCTGTLAPGTYRSLTVPDGASCTLPTGTATVHGKVTVGEDAALQVVPGAVLNVNAGVTIESGATFVMGEEEGPDTGTINGGIRADDPAQVQVHFARVNGGIRMTGGSGPGDLSAGFEGLFFSTIEDSHINGTVRIDGYNGFWFGFIRNHVNGGVRIENNMLPDPDGNEIVTNQINGNLRCTGNTPAAQVGDSEGQPNVVSGRKIGECAAL